MTCNGLDIVGALPPRETAVVGIIMLTGNRAQQNRNPFRLGVQGNYTFDI